MMCQQTELVKLSLPQTWIAEDSDKVLNYYFYNYYSGGGLWISPPITYILGVLRKDPLMTTVKMRNGCSKKTLFQCSHQHLNTALRKKTCESILLK